MKLLYTYIDNKYPEFIPVEQLYAGLYSCLKNLKTYGNATLYSNKSLISKFKELDLPFTDYKEIELDTLTYKTANVPKLEVYSKQKEPFIHSDFDLTVFTKINRDNKSGILFSNPDIDPNWNFSDIKIHSEGYFEPIKYFSEKYGSSIFENLKFNEIPNSGLLKIDNPDLFKSAVDKTLTYYYDNHKYFDELHNRFIFLDQGLLHNILLRESEEYTQDNLDVNTCIYDRNIVLYTENIDNKVVVNEIYNSSKVQFDNLDQFVKNYNFDNIPAAHFMGGIKYFLEIQLIIIDKLVKELGLEKLEKIEQYFGSGKHKTLDLYKRLFL